MENTKATQEAKPFKEHFHFLIFLLLCSWNVLTNCHSMNYKYRTWINLQELLKLLFVSELCEAKLVMSKLSHLRQFRIQINGPGPVSQHTSPSLPCQWNWKQIFVAQNSIYLFHCFVCWPFGETENINFDWSDTFDQYCHYNWWTQSSGPGHWAHCHHSSQSLANSVHWLHSSSFTICSTGYIYKMRKMRINRLCV